LSRELGDRESEITALTNLAILVYSAGHEDDAIALTEEAANVAHAIGIPRIEIAARSNLATARTRRGELAQAERDALTSVALLPKIAGDVETAADVWLGYAYFLIRAGRLDEAERAIDRAEHDWRPGGRSGVYRARLAFARRDYARSVQLIEAAKKRNEAWLGQYDQMHDAFVAAARGDGRKAPPFEEPIKK
jgi:tetratricopeptide (TPR) repeat protein